MSQPTTKIYTDASYNSVANNGRGAIAMVICAPSSITEHVVAIEDVANIHDAEALAAVWACECAIENGLNATVFTDSEVVFQAAQFSSAFYTYPRCRLAELIRANHPVIKVKKIKRGSSVFNRRADHLSRNCLAGTVIADLGFFLADVNLHTATKEVVAAAATKSSDGVLDVSVAARVKVVQR